MPLGTTTLASLRSNVARFLNDPTFKVWSSPEVSRYLDEAYRTLAHSVRIFWDWVYFESLPRGFSYNQIWEKSSHLVTSNVGFDFGRANFNHDWEREEYRRFETAGNEDQLEGPANHTLPWERTKLSGLGEEYFAAVQDLPSDTVEIDRALWDKAETDALHPRDLELSDTRYETTKGEMFGYLWRKDGLYDFRKVRVPAESADTYSITGNWGAIRDPDDLTGSLAITGSVTLAQTFSFNQSWEPASRLGSDFGQANFNYSWESGLLTGVTVGPSNLNYPWEQAHAVRAGLAYSSASVLCGIVRRIPGHHGFGYTTWGLARRPYQDGKNVRVERWREGRDANVTYGEFELPDRYTVALRDYAIYRCLVRPGDGQDLRLSGIFQLKWTRAIERLNRRVTSHRKHRTGRMGGEPVRSGPPPRPRLPWQYGQRVR